MTHGAWKSYIKIIFWCMITHVHSTRPKLSGIIFSPQPFCTISFEACRRKFSPPRPRPVRSEFPVRERYPYPGPAKKPRLESHAPYVAPEKRAYAMPVPRPAGPKVNNPQTSFEMRPVVYNAPSKISELQPLSQRPKPVQKPQPKPTPPTQPVKPTEKQTPIDCLQKQVPLKPAGKQISVKSTEKQMPNKPGEKQMPVKPGAKQMPVNTAGKQVLVNPAGKQVPANTPGKQVPVNTPGKQVPVSPASKQAPVNTPGKQVPVNPAGKQVPVNSPGKQALINPAGKQVPVNTSTKQVPVNPAGKQVPVNTPGKQVPVNPASKKMPANPLEKQVPVNTPGKQVPVNPAGKQVPANPLEKQVPVNTPGKQVPVNTPGKQVPVNPPGKQVPVNPPGKQVPVNTPGKQVPINPVGNQVPVKPAVKQVPVKAAVQKQPAKLVVQEAQTAEEEGPGPREDAVELTSVDGNSLSALASRVLAEEIQDIMDKVAQELPEAPTQDADKLVVERFRTVVGDDIRNALGLNVTTRILDMNNPLYVKLGFSGKPEAGCLQAFIARFKIGAFKRIAAPGDTFAARLDSAPHFDRLCADKKLRCGTANVTVTPCYKFLTCPSEVKSIYAVNNEVKTEKSENQYSSDQTLTESEDIDKNAENTFDNNAAATDEEKVTIKEKYIKIKEEVDNTLEETEPEMKIEIGETVVETRPEAPVKTRKPTAGTSVKVNITIEAASKLDRKDVPRDIKLEIKDKVTEDIDNDTKIKKEMLKGTENSGPDNTIKSEKNLDNKTSKESNISSVEDMVDEQLGGDEELSDRDILAFISGGLVLDECSGSEDEK